MTIGCRKHRDHGNWSWTRAKFNIDSLSTSRTLYSHQWHDWYSELLLEEQQIQQETTLLGDLQKIHACSQQLLKLVSTILDPAKLEMNQIWGELNGFSSTLRVELLTPLSTIGYCEMLLEEAPAALIPDLDSLNASAQQLLTLVNDIVSLAQQQLQILSTQQEATPSIRERGGAAFLQSATTTLQTLAKSLLKSRVRVG